MQAPATHSRSLINSVLSTVLFASGLFYVGSVIGATQTHTVSQEKKKFDVKRITVKVGDSITFVNNDDAVHTTYAKGKTSFNSGAQTPGDEYTVTFDQPGKVKVRCAIHPRMRVTVVVKDS